VRNGKGKTEEEITEGKTGEEEGGDGGGDLHFFRFFVVNTFFACNDCHEKELAV
jgi:hypothetical protein